MHGVDEKNVANLNLRGPGVDHNEDTPARARKCIKNRRPAGDGSSKRSIDGSPTGEEYGREDSSLKRVGRDQRAAPNSRVDPSRDPRAVVPRARPARVLAAAYSPTLSARTVLPTAVCEREDVSEPTLAATCSSHRALSEDPQES